MSSASLITPTSVVVSIHASAGEWGEGYSEQGAGSHRIREEGAQGQNHQGLGSCGHQASGRNGIIREMTPTKIRDQETNA